MIIKVLGTGCANCRTLLDHTKQAVSESGIRAEVQKVEDITRILEYRVMRTPALVFDEQVVMHGRVPAVSEIRQLIQEHINKAEH